MYLLQYPILFGIVLAIVSAKLTEEENAKYRIELSKLNQRYDARVKELRGTHFYIAW